MFDHLSRGHSVSKEGGSCGHTQSEQSTGTLSTFPKSFPDPLLGAGPVGQCCESTAAPEAAANAQSNDSTPVVKILAAPGMGSGVEPPILFGVSTVVVGDTLVGTGIGLTGVEMLTMAVGRGIVVGVRALGDNGAVGQQMLQVILVLSRRDRIMRARVAPRANPALPPARAESPLLRRTLIAVLRRLPLQQVFPPLRMEQRVWIHQRETKRLAKAPKWVK